MKEIFSFTADFGLSKIVDDQVTMKTVCGTPGYCGEYKNTTLVSRSYEYHIHLSSLYSYLYGLQSHSISHLKVLCM